MKAPSIVRELGWIVGLGALLMAGVVALAAVLAVDEEVDELLDDALRASAEGLASLVTVAAEAASAPEPTPRDDNRRPAAAARAETRTGGGTRFAWALLDARGQPLRHGGAVQFQQQLPTAPAAGFSDLAQWRVYGQAVGDSGHLLLVAQSREERHEAQQEMAMAAVLAALGVTCLCLPLLLARTRRGLLPLERLSQRLAQSDLSEAPNTLALTLGPAERQELQPIHTALHALGGRLAQRLQFERAFAAQAAHLLRTPLAGIDAQLAIALKEQPGQPRLVQVRAATTRLQRLVLALLRLFRSTPELNCQHLDARALLAELPIDTLVILPGPPLMVLADAELLAAALLNLLDNALRHGGHQIWLTAAGTNGLLISDDGPGVSEPERLAILATLSGHSDNSREQDHRLGLRLADLVARAHGGRLSMPALGPGFHVQLDFGVRS